MKNFFLLSFLFFSFMSMAQFPNNHRFGGKIQSPKYSIQPMFGLSLSTKNDKGLWLTLNKDPYFLYEFHFMNDKSDVIHYQLLNYSSTRLWNHQRITDIENSFSWGIGAGKKIRSFGIHSSIHLNSINVRYQFIDPTYTLSSTGRYTISGHQRGFVSLKTGVLYKSKYRCTFKFDVQYLPVFNFFIGGGFRF